MSNTTTVHINHHYPLDNQSLSLGGVSQFHNTAMGLHPLRAYQGAQEGRVESPPSNMHVLVNNNEGQNAPPVIAQGFDDHLEMYQMQMQQRSANTLRSKILLYQKPMTGTSTNLHANQNNPYSYLQNNNMMQAHQESSAISSVSNTVLGQNNANRMQSNYFSIKDGTAFSSAHHGPSNSLGGGANNTNNHIVNPRNARFTQNTSSSNGDHQHILKPQPLWSRLQHQQQQQQEAPTSVGASTNVGGYTTSYQSKNLMRASGAAYGSAPRQSAIGAQSGYQNSNTALLFGQSQISQKPVTANSYQQPRRRVIATANPDFNGRRPQTMGLNHGPLTSTGHINHQHHHIHNLNQSQTMSETSEMQQAPLDPRRVIKEKKQKLQYGFYETLRHGQNIDDSNTTTNAAAASGNAAKRINSTMALNSSAQTFTKMLDHTSNDQQQTKTKLQLSLGTGAALSMKTNNLKYHLMRDLLQKKSLEEIIQLKQRLLQTAKVTENERKKSASNQKKKGMVQKQEIHMPPGPKYTTSNSVTNNNLNNVQTNPIASPGTVISSHSSQLSSPTQQPKTDKTANIRNQNRHHSKSSNSKSNSSSTSSSSSEEEDDAEPFDNSQNTTSALRIHNNASPTKRPETSQSLMNAVGANNNLLHAGDQQSHNLDLHDRAASSHATHLIDRKFGNNNSSMAQNINNNENMDGQASTSNFNVNIVRQSSKQRINVISNMTKTTLNSNKDQQTASNNQTKNKKSGKKGKLQNAQVGNLCLIAARRFEEKRLSQPYKLEDEQCPIEDQASLITRYNYKGVPPEGYKIDQKAVPVRLRKRRLDEQTAFENYCGCKKFTTRQHHSHVHQAAQNTQVQWSKGGDRVAGGSLSHRGGGGISNRQWSPVRRREYAADDTAFMSNQTLAPFMEESEYGLSEKNADFDQERELMLRNNQLKHLAFLESYQQQQKQQALASEVLITSAILTSQLEDKHNNRLKLQNVEMAAQMNQGLGIEKIMEREKRDKYAQEMERAKLAVENIKRLRIDEGPEDPSVYNISKKVDKIIKEREQQRTKEEFEAEAVLLMSKGDPLNDKIRKGIQEEKRVMKETFEVLGGFEPVFKIPPAIKPIGGAEPVKVDQEIFRKSKKGVGSLSDLVLTNNAQKQLSSNNVVESPQQYLHYIREEEQHQIYQQYDETTPQKTQQQSPSNNPSDDPFVRWGTINNSLQQVLNTQKFGDVYSVTTKEETIIKDFLFRRYPVLKEHQVQFKIGKVHDTEYSDDSNGLNLPSQLKVNASQFNVVFYGPRCPLSKCCKMSLCLCICGITATAKVNCMSSAGTGGGALLNHYNPQQQYPIDLDLLRSLFPHRYASQSDNTSSENNQHQLQHQVTFQNVPRLTSIRESGDAFNLPPKSGDILSSQNALLQLNSARSSQQQQQQTREQQLIDSSVNRAVIAGTHKFQSLRAVAVASREQIKRKGGAGKNRNGAKKRRQNKADNEKMGEDSMDEGIDEIFGDQDDENVDIDMDDMMGQVDEESSSHIQFHTIKENPAEGHETI